MTTEEGSIALRQRCQEMAGRLLTLRDQFEIGDVYHFQHGDFADRAAQFAGFVDAARFSPIRLVSLKPSHCSGLPWSTGRRMPFSCSANGLSVSTRTPR